MADRAQLSFRNFTWLNFKTTRKGVAFTWKQNDIGYEEFQADIQMGIAHPRSSYDNKFTTWDGRFFNVDNKLFFAEFDEINEEINIKEIVNDTTITTRITWLSRNNTLSKDKVRMGKFYMDDPTTLERLTHTSHWDNFVEVSDTLVENQLIGKFLFVDSTKFYYITGNTTNTIYTDWPIEWTWTWVEISDSIECYRVSTWFILQYFDKNFTILLTNRIESEFTEKLNNRLIYMTNSSIYISTLNMIWWQWYYAYIPVPSSIMDTFVYKDKLYIFTQDGTYTLEGSSNASFALKKISNFSTNTRVYPQESLDNLFLSTKGQLKTFWPDGIGTVQYNYSLIPDTQAKLFSVKNGVIFNLWHTATTRRGKLNIEEINNNKKISIVDFQNIDIRDIIEFNWAIRYYWVIWASGYIFKENTTTPQNVYIKTNKIVGNKKIWLDEVWTDIAWSYPDTIIVIADWVTYTINKNTLWGRISYPINKFCTDFQIILEAGDPVIDFILYYK